MEARRASPRWWMGRQHDLGQVRHRRRVGVCVRARVCFHERGRHIAEAESGTGERQWSNLTLKRERFRRTVLQMLEENGQG